METFQFNPSVASFNPSATPKSRFDPSTASFVPDVAAAFQFNPSVASFVPHAMTHRSSTELQTSRARYSSIRKKRRHRNQTARHSALLISTSEPVLRVEDQVGNSLLEQPPSTKSQLSLLVVPSQSNQGNTATPERAVEAGFDGVSYDLRDTETHAAIEDEGTGDDKSDRTIAQCQTFYTDLKPLVFAIRKRRPSLGQRKMDNLVKAENISRIAAKKNLTGTQLRTFPNIPSRKRVVRKAGLLKVFDPPLISQSLRFQFYGIEGNTNKNALLALIFIGGPHPHYMSLVDRDGSQHYIYGQSFIPGTASTDAAYTFVAAKFYDRNNLL